MIDGALAACDEGSTDESLDHLLANVRATPLSKVRVYVCGPMRRIAQFNFPAFFAAEEQLRQAGFEVFNPARRDVDRGFDPSKMTGHEDLSTLGFDLRDALAVDMAYISREADMLVVLPGWEQSSGATAEVALARAIGIPVETLAGDPVPTSSGEVRSTSPTGAEKGVKLARFDLIPAGPLWTLAELYGRGSEKYACRNWELGYEWSKSFAALNRHAWSFWQRQDIDPETRLPHLAAVAWHALAMLEWAKTHPEFDDRP